MKLKFLLCVSLLLIFSSPVFAATKLVDKIDQFGSNISINAVSPQDKFYAYLSNKDGGSDYNYYAYNGKVVGPISLYSGTGQSNPQFSDDGSILMLYGKLQNGESYVYKNGNVVNKLEPYNNRPWVIFSNKSGKVYYSDINNTGTRFNILIDGKTTCSFDRNDQVGSSNSNIDNIGFDGNGKNLYFVYSFENPDFTKQAKAFSDQLRAQDGAQLNNLEKQLNGGYDPKIIQEIQAIKDKEAGTVNKFKKDFQVHSWTRRDVLYKNCQPGENFDEISDFILSRTNTAFFGRVKNILYLVINSKKQAIDSNFQAEEGAIQSQYRNLSISNDGRRYAYLKQSVNSSNFTVNINGKLSEVYSIGSNNDGNDNGPGNVLFSSDSKHYAYKASLKDNNYFVILDGKKSAYFVADSQNGDSAFTKPLFDNNGNLYYIAKQENIDCIFINKKKEECGSGLINDFEVNLKNGNYYYTDTSLDRKSSYLHIGKKKFGPYFGSCRIDIQSISPDFTRMVYKACPGSNYSQSTYIDGLDPYKLFGLSTDGGTTIVTVIGFDNSNKAIYTIHRENNLDKYSRYSTLREPNHVLYSSNDLELSRDCLGPLNCGFYGDVQVAFHNGYSAIWRFYKKDNALWVDNLKIK
ncbi:MAG: hypothetical protein NT007_13500 [Candidatus Kapabacteria bacterium]|nr:hypothetical protein [Candidatus Kapabacteria bacterium]